MHNVKIREIDIGNILKRENIITTQIKNSKIAIRKVSLNSNLKSDFKSIAFFISLISRLPKILKYNFDFLL